MLPLRKTGEERRREYEKELKEMTIPATSVRGSGKVNHPGIGDIRISGSGHVSSDEIRVSGSGRLPGGIKVGRVKSSGSVSVGGDIEASEMRFSGSASIMGSVRATSLSASGSFRAEGGATGRSMQVSGSCKIGNEIRLEDSLIVHGSLSVEGDVNALKHVELDGSFDIDGKLTTSMFTAELSHSRSYVRRGIQADHIDVRKGRAEGFPFSLSIFGGRFREGELITTDILGSEEVYLENVRCDNVTGKDVTVGEGCEVKGKIRYSSTIEVHPSARVRSPPEKIASEAS